MTSPNILSFIKTVYADTGTASDINYLIVIVSVLFGLAFVLLMVYWIVKNYQLDNKGRRRR